MEKVEWQTLRKILRLLKGIHIHPGYALIPVALSLCAAAFEGAGMGLLIPILNGFLQKNFAFITEAPIIGPLIQKLPPFILENDRMLFGSLVGGFIVVYVLKNVLRYLSTISMVYFALRCIHHLRKTLFTRYLSFGKQFFDKTNVGHHGTMLLEFTQLALHPVLHIDRNMNALFSLTVYFIVMMSISWKLTLIALPLFIFLHLVIKSMLRHIRKLSKSIAARGLDLGKQSVEVLSTIPLVKSYCTESLEQKRYTHMSDEKAKLEFRVRILRELLLPLQEIITLLMAALVFVGALAIFGRDELASAPALLVYFYIVVNATSKFGVLMSFRSRLASATGPLDAVLEIFDDKGKYFVQSGKEEFPGLKNQIEFRDLTFGYGEDREVLKHVSCRLEKGKMTAVVGPTGAGKSTLINLSMRFYDCPPGTIFIDGKDVRNFKLHSYLERIALVSQDALLLNDSLRNNITYGLGEVSDEDVQDVVERARLTDFVSQLSDGLSTPIGDRGVQLSGGEKQRVSIARALLKGAEILILDEATSSMDSQTEKLIKDAIDEAVQGRTSIVIAHRLSTIKNADTIIVLKDGQIAEQGTLEELLADKGVFFGLWEEQKF